MDQPEKAALEPESEAIQIPLERVVGSDIQTRYADSFTANHGEEEFRIGFYEVDRPLLVGTEEENRKLLQELGTLKAHCVARILVTPRGMRVLIDVLQRNLDSWEKRVRRDGTP